MRYRVIANLASGTRLEVSTTDRERADTWWAMFCRLGLAGPHAISLTQESSGEKDVVLAIGEMT